MLLPVNCWQLTWLHNQQNLKMCGIAGYYGFTIRSDEQINRCLHLMRHRGPDAQSSYTFHSSTNRTLHLLHARLNIIDLDVRSNQPFRVGDKVMVYNGELYNYVELKQELLAAGESFITESDTEVLLKAMRYYGDDVLDRAEGMWSFAVFDETSERLLLCRDRFGEKPLFVYEDVDGFYFASEPKLICALLGKPLKPNINHLYRYMVNGYKALHKYDDTFFKGLRRLPPAHVLRVDADGNQTLSRYWTPSFQPDDNMSYSQAVEGVCERMIESVKLRLRADVPLAFCMSGGVDSNALISIAKNVFHYDVHGFTIINSDERYEENDMVNLAVSTQGLRHTPIPVQTDHFLVNLRNLVHHHDSPVSTISYYAHWLLMQGIANAGYRISVSGTAADELFTGYYDHHLLYLSEIHSETDLFETARNNWLKYIKPIVRNPFLQNPEQFVNAPSFRGHIFLNADEFSSFLFEDWHEEFEEHDFGLPLLRNRMWNELFHESVPPILHEDDLNAMYFSIENRSPFLDRKLFEFSNRIPTRFMIQDGKTKSVLRDAMKGIAPDAVMQNRRKVGFNAPIFDFLNVRNEHVKMEVLADSPIYNHVRRDKIETMLNQPDLPNSGSKFLFYFLCSKLFLEEFGSE